MKVLKENGPACFHSNLFPFFQLCGSGAATARARQPRSYDSCNLNFPAHVLHTPPPPPALFQQTHLQALQLSAPQPKSLGVLLKMLIMN